MNSIKHILVPTDFSEPSERALAMALSLAQKFGSQLTLLHVWAMPLTAYSEGLTWPVEGMERAAQTALEDVRARVAKVHPRTDAIVRQGGDWSQILAVVEEQGIDLVVMGTHGRRGLPRLVVGSVAEKLVRLSPVPVLTVGAPADETKESAKR